MSCSFDDANKLSRMTYWWLSPMLKLGKKQTLNLEDMPQVPEVHRVERVAEDFFSAWKKEKQRAAEKGVQPRLWRTYLHTGAGRMFLRAIVYKLPNDILQFIGPYILMKMMDFVNNEDEPAYLGWVYTLLMFLGPLIQSIALQHYWTLTYGTGQDVRSATCMMVYDKALKLSPSARQKMTEGEIINLMSVDAARMLDLFPYLHNLWSGPLQILICLGFLVNSMGIIPTLITFVLLLLLVPLNKWLTKKMGAAQEMVMKRKDVRTKLMNETLQGIRLVKMYGWEESFENQIVTARLEETKKMMLSGLMGAFTFLMGDNAPILIAMFAFLAYELQYGGLTAQMAFTSLAILNIMKFPISILPMVVTNVVKAKVAYGRLEAFMLREEIDKDINLLVLETQDDEEIDAQTGYKSKKKGKKGEGLLDGDVVLEMAKPETEDSGVLQETIVQDPTETRTQLEQMRRARIVARFRNASFSWSKEAPQPTLRAITFDMPKGKLVSVLGVVGSGKSTMMQAIFGDVPLVNGGRYLDYTERIAYCAQQPWLRNATVRGNIIGQSAFDEARYQRVIKACGLDVDLALLPAGDDTEIGERGINMSGGQKARITLARACYMDADLYLLDAPLSAVDPHVAVSLFNNVIRGLLKGKTVVLITHSLQFLRYSDLIVVLADGMIEEMGTYEDLMQANLNFASLVASHGHGEEEKDTSGHAESASAQATGTTAFEKGESMAAKSAPGDVLYKAASPLVSPSSQKPVDSPSGSPTTGKIVKDEVRAQGSVNWKVYWMYVKFYGAPALSIIGILTFVGPAAKISIDALLAVYTGAPGHMSSKSFYIIYGVLWIIAFLLGLARTASFMWGALKCGTTLHDNMLRATMRAPISWFEANPVGRIINRFSGDQDNIDQALPQSLNSLILCLVRVLSVIVVVLTVTPLFAVILPPMMFLYYYIQMYYRYSSREVKRLDSTTKSPIFHLLGETISGSGLPTIRAHREQDWCLMQNVAKVESNTRPYWVGNMLNRWLGLRLEFVGTCIVMFACLMAVFGRGKVAASFVGLSLSYALSFTNTFGWMVRMVVMLETQLTSVERVVEYADLPDEEQGKFPNDPPAGWPESGALSFSNVCMRYRPDLDLVLKNVTADIAAGQKVGIVGRTGSGKSSLLSCLFRVVELDRGKIVVDGIDISTLTLRELRQRFAIIPQDPVMFSGSVRFNLDPTNEHSDDELWAALRNVHLDAAIEKIEGGLDGKVSEHGENFSVGERQLMCLARALVRQSRVVVLDEATANVDVDTDSLVQLCVREHFKHSTVLTIAHRIQTIIDYDRILVLDRGVLQEYDTPANLLANSSSAFYGIVQQHGASAAQHLTQIARGEINYQDYVKSKLDQRAKGKERST